MSGNRSLLKNSGAYTLGSLLQKTISFVLLPLYTSRLDTRQYGIVAVVSSIVSFLSVIYTLSLNAALQRMYFEYQDENARKTALGTIFTFSGLFSLLMTTVLLLFSKPVFDVAAPGIAFYPYVLLALATLVFAPHVALYLTLVQSMQRSLFYVELNLAIFLITTIGTIIGVTVFQLGASAVLGMSALGSLLIFVFSWFDLRHQVKMTIRMGDLKKSLGYSLPLIPHSLSGWVTTMIDRFLLNGIKSTAEVGVYSVGYQFGSIMAILVSSFNQAFIPWFYQRMGEGEPGKREIVRMSEKVLLVYCIVALGIGFFGKELLMIMVGRDFREAWKVIPFLSFSFVLVGAYNFFGMPLFVKASSVRFLPVASISGAAVNAFANVVLIPRFGMIGSSIANMASSLVLSIIALALSSKLERVEYHWGRMYALIGIFFLLSCSGILMSSLHWLVAFAIKAAIFVLISGIALVLNREYLSGLAERLKRA